MTEEIRIQVSVPTAGMNPSGFTVSLAGLVADFAANKVDTVPEAKITMMLRAIESSNWITNREKLAKQALDEGATHVMFLDDDMKFHPRVLSILLGRRQDIVVTNYLIKTMPPVDFVAVGLDGERVPLREGDTGLLPVLYSGFGVSLFRTEVLRKIPQPWFMPVFNPEKCEYTTEDNPFFARARAAGYTVYLDQDASQLVEHIGRHSWSWRDAKPVQRAESDVSVSHKLHKVAG